MEKSAVDAVGSPGSGQTGKQRAPAQVLWKLGSMLSPVRALRAQGGKGVQAQMPKPAKSKQSAGPIAKQSKRAKSGQSAGPIAKQSKAKQTG